MKRLAGALLLAMACQSQLISPADARPHRHHRHHHVESHGHRHHLRHARYQVRHYARHQVRETPAQSRAFGSWLSGAGSDVVSTARRYIGSGAVFGRATLWCARFMNYVLKQTGHTPTGSDLAMSFASKPATSMRVGAIAVFSRSGGGHVGVVSGIDSHGNPIVISGNHSNRVAESVYPRSRVVKFVSPS